MFRLEHCKEHKNHLGKLLILGAGFRADEWNRRVSLWKKCLFSRTSDAYESRLDSREAYFLWCMPEA